MNKVLTAEQALSCKETYLATAAHAATVVYRNSHNGIVIHRGKRDEKSGPLVVITDKNAVAFKELLAKVARE
jgi:hypothetical protein